MPVAFFVHEAGSTSMKNLPFAHVLYMEHSNGVTSVAACSTLKEIEEALRFEATSRWVGVGDNEILELLTEEGWRVRVFACTAHRRGQVSTELVPFARTAEAA
jgi:hypothetical protein